MLITFPHMFKKFSTHMLKLCKTSFFLYILGYSFPQQTVDNLYLKFCGKYLNIAWEIFIQNIKLNKKTVK